MVDRDPGLPPAIVHPGVPRPPARRFASPAERATLAVMAGALVVGVVAWAATRGGGSDHGRGLGLLIPGLTRDDDVERAIAQMEQAADELCACKDSACADRVMKSMSSMKEPSAKPDKAQMERAMKLAERMQECQRKLMAAGDDDRPAPDP